MSGDKPTEQEETQFSQNFRSANIHSGDGTGGGRGGDIGSYNNVNSNNSVTHNTTYHIYSDEQLAGISFSYVDQGLKLKHVRQLSIQASASLSSQGSSSLLRSNSRSPAPVVNVLDESRPHFIFNDEGQALDLSNNDQKTILPWHFHGGQNQQWFLSSDGQGEMAFMCMKNRRYLAFKRLEEDAALFLSETPFYWEVSPHGEKYRISIPKSAQGLSQSNLALSIGSHVASLRPYFETLNTLLYVLAGTTENRTKIQLLKHASTAGLSITTPPISVHPEDDIPINLDGRTQYIFSRREKCLDLSGSDGRTLIPWGFHGNLNQQWVFERQTNGFFALKSRQYPLYISFERLIEDAGLFCTPDPENYWELSRDKDGFNLGVPGSHLGIGLVGQTAKLRPLYEHLHTRLHLLENSEATVEEIRRGNFLKSVALNDGNQPQVTDAPRPGHLESFMSTIEEPCLIVSYTGTVLDLSYQIKRVYAYDYHGGENQQWVVQADGRGGATIRSLMFHYYVKYDELRLDSELALDASPFTWEMIKDRDGYRFAVPGTNFALSLGACARMRYLHEQPGTCVYLMDNSPHSRTHIQSGVVSSSTILSKSQKSSNVHISEDSKKLDIHNHGGQPQVPPTISRANKPSLPKPSRRPKFGKKSRDATGGSSSSSKDCTVQ